MMLHLPTNIYFLIDMINDSVTKLVDNLIKFKKKKVNLQW